MKEIESIGDVLGQGGEFVGAVSTAIKERITSPFYGRFFLAWSLINWELLYIAFFVEQEKIFEKTGLLRNEYINISLPQEPLLFLWCFFVAPMLAAAVLTWGMPYIGRLFYKRHAEEQKELRRIEIAVNIETRVEEKELIKEERKVIQEQAQKIREVKEIQKDNPELIWEEEYKAFKEHELFGRFQEIIDSVYKYRGRVKSVNEYGGQFKVDYGTLVFADTNGLIKPDLSATPQTIELTEKGKFFVKKFVNKSNQI